MHDQWEEIWYQLAEMRRQAGNTDRVGTVKETKGDKIRVSYGLKNDGKELLSPWLHTTDQRGGNRERHSYEKGQNVRVSSTAGTFRNGSVGHYAASKSFPAPPQADQINGHSGVCGKFAFSYNKSGGQQSQGGSSSASLAGTTEVQTPDGFTNIQELQLNDKVVSYNTSTDKVETDTVIGIHVEITEKKMLVLTYPGGSVHCTEDHLIWSERRKDYTQANSLYMNETLRNEQAVVGAESVKDLTVEPDTRVYHLSIKNNHNFFVREAGSELALLVHNQDSGGGGGGGGDDFGEFQVNDQAEQNPQHQDATGEMSQFGSQQQQPQQGGQQQQAPKAKMKTRLSDSGFITHRVGKNVRVAISDKEAILMYGESGENTVFCDQEGCHSTKPLTIQKPKSKLDNN